MRPDVDPDELFVNDQFTSYYSSLRRKTESIALDVLRDSGAVERLLRKKRDALTNDSSDTLTLMSYLTSLLNFLEMEFPDEPDLYREPLKFVISVLDQARRGSLHPVLVRKVHSRPTDSYAKKQFKVSCVVAGDLHYEADRQAGLKRRSLTRAQADDFICRQPGVQKAAKKLGLDPTPTAIKGWRREMREAPENSILKIFEMIARENGNNMLEERGADAAIAFLLSVHTNEHQIA